MVRRTGGGGSEVGDDVVDLRRPRTRGRSGDERLLERILTEEERSLIRVAADTDVTDPGSRPDDDAPAPADRLLWALWAAKEAAFKVHTKLRGEPPPFVHADYRVFWTPPARGGHDGVGEVAWEGGSCRVAVAQREWAVHAVAVDAPASGDEPGPGASPADPVLPEAAPGTGLPTPPVPSGTRLVSVTMSRTEAIERWGGDRTALQARFSDTEWSAVHSTESALVRLGARSLAARLLEVEEAEVALPCAPGPTGRRPPFVEVDGVPHPTSVSFTHDGDHLGWSVLVPRRDPGSTTG